jgi:hypothetical protein
MKEITMTRRVSIWITAVLSLAATALMIGLTIAAQTGPTQANLPLAGITMTGLD